MTVSTRLITVDDVPVMMDLLRANREFLAPWDPIRDADYYTIDGQRAAIETALSVHEQGTNLPHVIVSEGQVVGRITVSDIARGPFQSGNLGYWVAAACNGRGVGTAATRIIVRLAFEELGLHRIQACTLPHNVASQRILERVGFTRIGMAPRYLRIAGEWQDHAMFQLLADD